MPLPLLPLLRHLVLQWSWDGLMFGLGILGRHETCGLAEEFMPDRSGKTRVWNGCLKILQDSIRGSIPACSFMRVSENGTLRGPYNKILLGKSKP